MFYVGLDIHGKNITICILNCDGKVHQRCSVRQVDQLMTVLERLPGPFQVCYEASSGYGFFFELLSAVVGAYFGLVPSQDQSTLTEALSWTLTLRVMICQ